MSDFFGKLRSGAGKVAFEADKMTRVNRAQGELAQLKRQMEAQFTKLGELYYRNSVNLAADFPEAAAICQAIADLEKQAALKADDVARITAETYQGEGAKQPPAPAAPQPPAPYQAPTGSGPVTETPPVSMPPATPPISQFSTPAQPLPNQPGTVPEQPSVKICPNCGRQVAGAIKFCPDCGTKI